MQAYLDKRAEREILLKAPPAASCAFCSIDGRASKKLADYLLDGEFEQMRMAYLYGRWAEDENGKKGVQVDVMYEPPQQASSTSVELEPTAEAKAEVERAHTLAKALGLRFIGWAYSHPPRVNAFTTYDLKKMCAQRAAAVAAQSDAGERFVCVRFRPVYEGEDIDGDVTAEVYQPTEQCGELMEKDQLMDCPKVAGDAILKPELGLEFKLGVDFKESIDLAVFLSRVHNVARPYTSPLRAAFPYANRGVSVRKLHLRTFLQKQRDAGVPFLQVASDWQFLLHCSAALPPADMDALGAAIVAAGTGVKAKAALAKAEKLICEYCNLK